MGVSIFFIILTCLFTYPILLHLGSSIYGFPQFVGDPLGTMWWMWWYRYAWEKKMDSGFVPIVGYPFGMGFKGLPINPLLNYPVAWLNYLIGNEILTYNIFILLGIFLTALCMYFFVRHLTVSNLAGFVAGVIFGFCPNQLMHSAQHLGFTLNFWLPLYVLSLFRLKDKPCLRNSVLCGILGGCLVLANYYYGYFMLIFTIVFLAWFYIPHRLKHIGNIWVAGIVGFIIMAPFVIPIFLRHGEGGGVWAHPLKDLFKYSARWYDYFLPSEFHPIFGRWVQKFGRHYFERSLYVGYLPVVLGLYAIVRRKIPVVRFFGITIVLFFVLSVLPVFSSILFKIFPMFRVYARMGFLVIFSIAVLAGYGVVGMKRPLVGLFIFFILFEYLNFPPFHSVDLSNVPEVYQWLAKEPEDVIVVEYPFTRSIEARHSEYLFWQRVHKKPLVNGASEGTLGDAFRKECQDLSSYETSKLLAYLGVDYVLVHGDIGFENRGLELVENFPDARVYRVIAKPDSLVMVYWKNFSSPERWDDGNYWRWMGNNATVWIDVDEKKVVDIGFRILAFARNRHLEVYVNDLQVKKLMVTSPSNPELAQEVVLKNILLKPGGNVIRFYTPQGEDRIGDVLGNEDNRRVSFGISGLSIMEVK